MGLTIKAIHAHIKHDYPEVTHARAIRDMIKQGRGLSKILECYPHIGYDVEYLELEHKDGGRKYVAYINVGDSYASTFLTGMQGKIIISTLGDVIENLPSTWSVR